MEGLRTATEQAGLKSIITSRKWAVNLINNQGLPDGQGHPRPQDPDPVIICIVKARDSRNYRIRVLRKDDDVSVTGIVLFSKGGYPWLYPLFLRYYILRPLCLMTSLLHQEMHVHWTS